MSSSTRFWRAITAVTAAGVVAGVGFLPGQVGAAAPEANRSMGGNPQSESQ